MIIIYDSKLFSNFKHCFIWLRGCLKMKFTMNESSSSRKSFKVRNISLKEHPRHLIDIKTHKKENKTSTIF